ncbi:MAG: RDD family protein [Actinomycetota bacterium]|nr:RDD family protein [Actinomycetota bacterium]
MSDELPPYPESDPPPSPPLPPPYGSGPYGSGPYGSGPYGMPPPGSTPYGPGRPTPVDVLGRPLASWWQRLAAILIDSVILAIVATLLGYLFVGTSTAALGGGASSGAVVVVGVLALVIDLAYFGFLNGSEKGQTVGMMALGIAVRDVASGGRIDPRRAAIRIVVLDPGILLSSIPVIGVIASLYTIAAGLSPLWDAHRQGWHDKVARTDVIRVR